MRILGYVLDLEKDKDKYKWLLDGVCIRPSSLEQRGTSWETNRFHGYGAPLEIVPIKDNFVFYQWRGWEHGARGDIFEVEEPFPWVGIHMKCFDLMKRLVEYRTNVLCLVPDDSNSVPRVRDEYSAHVPASLGESYEVYQSRIYQMSTRSWSAFRSCFWKIMEPHLLG